MSVIHDQILVRLELACAARALQHAHERCTDEAVSRDLERLIIGLTRIYDVASAPPWKEDPNAQHDDFVDQERSAHASGLQDED